MVTRKQHEADLLKRVDVAELTYDPAQRLVAWETLYYAVRNVMRTFDDDNLLRYFARCDGEGTLSEAAQDEIDAREP